jgi:signal transduction histidine kinase/DNA-binding response OmpR family regulator
MTAQPESDAVVLEFLKNRLHQSQDLSDFLRLWSAAVGCEHIAAMGKFDGVYRCLGQSQNLDHFRFHPIFTVDAPTVFDAEQSVEISGKTHGIVWDHTLRNVVMVPVASDGDEIGVLLLVNFVTTPQLALLDLHEAALSLCQMMMKKHRILSKYHAMYNEAVPMAKDVFLANISHEIRTPLNGITGHTQLLRGTDLDEKQVTYVQNMNVCSIQLMKIINDVIDLSKLTSGSMTLQDECFHLSEVVSEVRAVLGTRLTARKQTCRFVVPDKETFIVMDKQKCIQIIVNLLSNASKFSDVSALIVVHLEIDLDTRKLTASVKDNGVGISEEDLGKLFNSFSQIDNKTAKMGSGLGLAIVKRLTELMGGEVNVISTFGLGSQFTCTIPFRIDSSLLQSSTNIEVVQGRQALVVDTDLTRRLAVADMLSDWQMRPTMCGSHEEARRYLLRKQDFDLALLSDSVGADLLEEVQTECPKMPVITLGSHKPDKSKHHLMYPVNNMKLFTMTVKLCSTIVKSVSRPAEVSKDRAKLKFLIAEDVKYNRDVLVHMLHEFGYHNIDIAEDGRECLQRINAAKDNPYDILLLDLRMPKLSGVDVLDYIAMHHLKQPIVIVVTACCMKIDRNTCASLGVKYFVDKPVNIQQLQKVVNLATADLCLL